MPYVQLSRTLTIVEVLYKLFFFKRWDGHFWVSIGKFGHCSFLVLQLLLQTLYLSSLFLLILYILTKNKIVHTSWESYLWLIFTQLKRGKKNNEFLIPFLSGMKTRNLKILKKYVLSCLKYTVRVVAVWWCQTLFRMPQDPHPSFLNFKWVFPIAANDGVRVGGSAGCAVNWSLGSVTWPAAQKLPFLVLVG